MHKRPSARCRSSTAKSRKYRMKSSKPVCTRTFWLSALPMLFFLFLVVWSSTTTAVARTPNAQEHHDHATMAHAGMAMDEPITPAQQAKLLADKRESEFNHHLSG